MAIRAAINGFGRIGRMILRAGVSHPDIEWVALNDLTDAKTLAYLFKYDSEQGRFPGTVEAKDDAIIINGKKIQVFAEKEPENLPWKNLGVDVVVESTGFFTKRSLASKHLTAGAKKVLISAPAKAEEGEAPVKTIVMGVNEHSYDGDNVVSNASCTTNCLAPMVKVLDDNFVVKRGFFTTIHAYTGTQKLVDGPNPKDVRRGRAAAVNLVPTTTGAAKSVGDVLPHVAGKLTGIAVRAPIPSGSFSDLTVEVEKGASVEEINQLFKNVSEHHLKGIVQVAEDPLVSTDIVGNPYSCIFDPSMTRVIDGTFVKICAFYDNEFGYSSRMVEMIGLLTSK